MIEIYCGDGKGKTTAAVGLALRAAGNGIPVLFIQFMKDGSSGEIKMLASLSGVTVCYPRPFYGFTSVMNEQQKEEMRVQYQGFLGMAAQVIGKQKNAQEENAHLRKAVQAQEAVRTQEYVQTQVDISQMQKDLPEDRKISLVVVLDEVIHACNKNLLKEEALLKLLEECPDNTELILTGRNPSKRLLEKADYISEIEKRRHPFDKGIPARKGIEL